MVQCQSTGLWQRINTGLLEADSCQVWNTHMYMSDQVPTIFKESIRCLREISFFVLVSITHYMYHYDVNQVKTFAVMIWCLGSKFWLFEVVSSYSKHSPWTNSTSITHVLYDPRHKVRSEMNLL